MPGPILLSISGLSKSLGQRTLFENLSLGLFEGERAGLIGPNGTGKSSLLRMLAGEDSPDAGEIVRRRGLRIGYLPQRDPDASSGTVFEEAARALQVLGLQDFEAERRIETGLRETGFSNPEQLVAELSGGRRKRLAVLCQALKKPDILLLDEPTNHLDLEGVLWLERFLMESCPSYLVVTHDRRFLERTANRIIELDGRHKGGFFSCEGNYSRFLEKREELIAARGSQEQSLRNVVRREIEWLQRGAKARATKQQARIDRAGKMKEELRALSSANAMTRAAEIDFRGSGRRGKLLIKAGALAKKGLFGPLDLFLGPGDKLGLLGPNGSGKTTFLRVLAGDLGPDSGSLQQAEGLNVVVFDQHREQLDLSLSLKKALCSNGEHVHFQGNAIHVASWADRFLFSRTQLEQPLSRLSGGEQSRVLIAQLMLKPADVLLLDEPTNDLDIRSLEVLESSLMEFPGALVLVTHDRFLLDRVCGEILALDGRGGSSFYADLDQWENRSEPKAAETAPTAAKLTSKEYKELKSLESGIARAETEIAAMKTALLDPAVSADSGELIKRQAAAEQAEEKLLALMERWSALEGKR